MARKIKPLGKGSASIDGRIENLSQYKSIEKYDFGYDEDPEGNHKFGIAFTPLHPSKEDIENGVDGTHILPYGEDEQADRDADYQVLMDSM